MLGVAMGMRSRRNGPSKGLSPGEEGLPQERFRGWFLSVGHLLELISSSGVIPRSVLHAPKMTNKTATEFNHTYSSSALLPPQSVLFLPPTWKSTGAHLCKSLVSLLGKQTYSQAVTGTLVVIVPVLLIYISISIGAINRSLFH